jgi:phosphoserine phosphatase
MDKKIYVFDLDFTFVSLNTFHYWILFTLKTFWYKPIVVVRILRILLKRYFRVIKHSEMKKELLELVNKKHCKVNVSKFTDFLENNINNNVFEYFLSLKNEITILATAAPDVYAIPFGQRLGFRHITATSSITDDNWVENIKEQKCLSVQKIIQSNINYKGYLIEVITDHHDDLPIMKLAAHTRLVNPSDKTLCIISKAGVNHFRNFD